MVCLEPRALNFLHIDILESVNLLKLNCIGTLLMVASDFSICMNYYVEEKRGWI